MMDVVNSNLAEVFYVSSGDTFYVDPYVFKKANIIFPINNTVFLNLDSFENAFYIISAGFVDEWNSTTSSVTSFVSSGNIQPSSISIETVKLSTFSSFFSGVTVSLSSSNNSLLVVTPNTSLLLNQGDFQIITSNFSPYTIRYKSSDGLLVNAQLVSLSDIANYDLLYSAISGF